MHTDNGTKTPTPATIAAVRAAADALANAGLSITEQRPAALARAADLANHLSSADGRAWTRRLLAKSGTSELHPWLSRRMKEAEPFEVGDFTALLEEVAL